MLPQSLPPRHTTVVHTPLPSATLYMRVCACAMDNKNYVVIYHIAKWYYSPPPPISIEALKYSENVKFPDNFLSVYIGMRQLS